MTVRIALEPADSAWLTQSGSGDWLVEAIVDGGGLVVDPADADALVWAHPTAPDQLRAVLADHPGLRWVQLPFAGIEAYGPVLDHDRVWTCGKRIYGETTAEHALTLILAALRDLRTYLRADRWVPDRGRSLHGARVTLVGAGGVAEALMALLAPFGCEITVVRRAPHPVGAASRTLPAERLGEGVERADVVVLALALTPETTGIVDRSILDAMAGDGWLVNVARGGHVVTADLVEALRRQAIGGAALDVTDPEPLPAGHPLWELDNCLVTPHVANTHAMLMPRLTALVTENVRRFGAGRPPTGTVDPDLGY
jgi:phosphoglycerate dehydrogenase-like enzyme